MNVRPEPPPGKPDHWAAEWVGQHPNYTEFELIWRTMANLTGSQEQQLAERWTNTPDRRLARGLALETLPELHGNLAAVTVRFLHVFGLPLPGADSSHRQDDRSYLAWLPDLATGHTTTQPAARAAAAFHDATLATIAFPAVSPEDYELLRQPWADVCLPCAFDHAHMFGEATPAAAVVFAQLGVLPRARLLAMGADRAGVPEEAWRLAWRAVAAAAAAAGFPYRVAVLYWWCVNLVDGALDEVATDSTGDTIPAVAQAVHAMAAARLFAGQAPPAAIALLEGPYTRAVGAPPGR